MKEMSKPLIIGGAVALVLLIFAAIVPMWTMTASIDLPPFALAMIVFMVLGCFGVGGGLMFLMFYSARRGHDDKVHNGRGWRDPLKPGQPPGE